MFVLFIVTVIAVGLIKSKGDGSEAKGAEDYFLAGRGLSWWLIGFSLIAANISAEQFVGMSGQGSGAVWAVGFQLGVDCGDYIGGGGVCAATLFFADGDYDNSGVFGGAV